MKCFACKNGEFANHTTTHVVDFGHCVVIVRNVPCEECEICGEKVYSDEVAQRLDEIVQQACRLMNEVSIIDYRMAA